MTAILELQNITLRVENKLLLKDASLKIRAGEKVALTGASGCGKSTLLTAVIGWVPLESGKIIFDGIELNEKTLQTIRSQISYLQQTPVLEGENVRNVLLFPFHFHANRKLEKPTELELSKALHSFNLAQEILDQNPVKLSDGERQRLAAARSFLLPKSLFFADEMTSALDNENRDSLLQNFLDLPQTVLAVAHDFEILKRHSRIIRFKNLKLIEDTR